MTELIKSNADQLDLFVADLIDVTPKSDIDSMEYPFFAISTRPDTSEFRFENPKTGSWLEISPSTKGRATILDKDLLIYCYGQLAEAENRGRPISRRLKITPYDFMKTTCRSTDGRAYKRLVDTVARLRGTVFRTNIVGNHKNTKGHIFGLIDNAKWVTDQNGRMQYLEITLSEELYSALGNRKRILTYCQEYFALSSPWDRRMYEICRKHCGNQMIWEIGLEKLWYKFGAKSQLKEFRRMLKKAEAKQNIPDYFISYEKGAKGSLEKLIVMNDKKGIHKAQKEKNLTLA